MTSRASQRAAQQQHQQQQRASGARKKRPAFNLTCANCRRRKMRCDSGQPGCLICAAYGDQCQYDKAPPVSQVVTMAKRLQQLEDVMNQLKHSDNDEVQRIVSKLDGTQPLNSKSISVAPSETASNPDLDGRASDSISVTRRDSIDSTVPSLMSELSMTSDGQLRYYGATSAVHQPVAVPPTPSSMSLSDMANGGDSRSLLVLNASQSRGWEDYAMANAAMQLDIPRETIAKLLNNHWTWIHPLLMFVYRPAFISDMYTNGPYYSPFLLSVVCTHSTRFVEQQLADALVARCRLLLGAEILKDSSIPTVQGLLQLSAREMGHGLVSQAWLYSGMAFRMSMDLGLHVSSESISSLSQLSATDKEVRRRIAWACYLWDKVISLYIGRTPTLQEPPSDEPAFLDDFEETEAWIPNGLDSRAPASNTEYPLTPSYAVSCFRNFCKLGVIVNDILIQLYTKRQEDISSFVRDTKGRLDAWRAHSDKHLRIDMHNLPSACPPPHIIFQNMLFFASVILLHRPLHNVMSCRAASREAYQNIEALLLLMERTFGFERFTYLVGWATYVATSVAVEDMNDGSAMATESVRNFIRALEGAKRTCPIIQVSLDIIHRSIARRSPTQLALVEPVMHAMPHPNQIHPGMPAPMPTFPYQQMQVDIGSRQDIFAVDPTMSSAMLNAYPQHYLDLRDDNWSNHM